MLVPFIGSFPHLLLYCTRDGINHIQSCKSIVWWSCLNKPNDTLNNIVVVLSSHISILCVYVSPLPPPSSLGVVIVTFGCEMAKDCKALILEAETGNLASRIDLSSLSKSERSQESSMARENVVLESRVKVCVRAINKDKERLFCMRHSELVQPILVTSHLFPTTHTHTHCSFSPNLLHPRSPLSISFVNMFARTRAVCQLATRPINMAATRSIAMSAPCNNSNSNTESKHVERGTL